MAFELINPPDLPQPQTYSQVAVAPAGRLVFVAGQVAEDGDGRVVGGDDLGAQARQAFGNLGRALAAAGTRPQDVGRITIYVAGLRPEDLPAIEAGRASLFGDHRPADTLVGVETLAHPGCRIEVDAVAVVP